MSAELERIKRRIDELRAVELQRGLRRIGIHAPLEALLPLDHPRKRHDAAALTADNEPRVLRRNFGERVRVVR